MTHNYYFIDAGRIIDSNTKFYLVAVGTSKQADRDFLYLTAYAADHQCYFERVSEHTDAFVQRIAQSIAPVDKLAPMASLNMQHVSARELVRCLKTSTAVPSSVLQEQQQAYLLSQLSVNYRAFRNIAKSNPHA